GASDADPAEATEHPRPEPSSVAGSPALATPSPAVATPAAAARASLGAVLDRWADHAAAAPVARETSPGYRLRTRAADGGYANARASLREEAQVLHQAWRDDRAPDPEPPVVPVAP